MGIKPEKLQKQSKLRRCPVQFAGRWEQGYASNKERNRVASRLDFDVKGAAASGRRHCRSRQQAQTMAHRRQIAPLSGAICGKMGRKYCFEQRKKSSRCPTRFRCEKRGSKWLPRLAGSGDDLLSRAVSSQVPSAC